MRVTFAGPSIAALVDRSKRVTHYSFNVIVTHPAFSDDQILNATDALAQAGCTDASIRGHREGMELLFDREAESLEAAIHAAVRDVKTAGYEVARIEIEADALRQSA